MAHPAMARARRLIPGMVTARLAVVTGAAHGIGLATAELLAGTGYGVYLCDVVAEEAARQAARLTDGGCRAWPVALDVSDDAHWASLASEISQRHGRLDAVVNNAYSIQVMAAHQTAPADWAHQIEVCLGQIHRSLYHLHDHLHASPNPAMVNISSVHARVTEAGHAAYAAAKGAIEAVTRQLAIEYGPWLRVNAVAPGAILTRTWDGIGDDIRAQVAERTPLRRFGSPAEIARVVRFLLSEDASFITGATVIADGGWSVSKGVE